MAVGGGRPTTHLPNCKAASPPLAAELSSPSPPKRGGDGRSTRREGERVREREANLVADLPPPQPPRAGREIRSPSPIPDDGSPSPLSRRGISRPSPARSRSVS
ncbi:hypothetical protein ABZP36_030259 [Zizania latifolia]